MSEFRSGVVQRPKRDVEQIVTIQSRFPGGPESVGTLRQVLTDRGSFIYDCADRASLIILESASISLITRD